MRYPGARYGPCPYGWRWVAPPQSGSTPGNWPPGSLEASAFDPNGRSPRRASRSLHMMRSVVGSRPGLPSILRHRLDVRTLTPSLSYPPRSPRWASPRPSVPWRNACSNTPPTPPALVQSEHSSVTLPPADLLSPPSPHDHAAVSAFCENLPCLWLPTAGLPTRCPPPRQPQPPPSTCALLPRVSWPTPTVTLPLSSLTSLAPPPSQPEMARAERRPDAMSTTLLPVSKRRLPPPPSYLSISQRPLEATECSPMSVKSASQEPLL